MDALSLLLNDAGLVAWNLLWQGVLVALLYRLVVGWGRLADGDPRWRLRFGECLLYMLPVTAIVPVAFASVGAPVPTAWPETAEQSRLAVPLLSDLVPLLGALWGATVAVAALRLMVAHAGGRWRVATGAPVEEAMRARMKTSAARLGLPPDVPVRCRVDVRVPQVVGVLHPTVLLPMDLLDRLRGDEIDSVLVHELMHIHRRDALAKFAQEVAMLPLAFHPAMRALAHRLDLDRELACDDAVVAAGVPARSYLSGLARLALSLEPIGVPAPALSLAGGDTVDRLRRVQGYLRGTVVPCRPHQRLGWLLSVSAVGAIAGLGGMSGGYFHARHLLYRTPTWQDHFLAREHGGFTVHATDPRGAFSLSVRDGRVVGATLESGALPAERIRQKGAVVMLAAPDRTEQLRLVLRPAGGIGWSAREPLDAVPTRYTK